MTQSINSNLPGGYGKTILTSAELDDEIVAVSTYKGTTAAIGGTALSAYRSTAVNVAISGVAVGMSATASPDLDPGAGIVWGAFIPATGIVTVRELNATNVNVTPVSTTFTIRVLP